MTKDLHRTLLKAKIKDVPIAEAKAQWLEFRKKRGYKSLTSLLTSPESNAKLKKSHTDATIYGLSLAPANLSSFNACRFSTSECRSGCVAYAGKGELPNIADARIAKTEFLAENPSAFYSILRHELTIAKQKHGDKLAVRLNTFSDIPWEEVNPALFKEFKDIQFYDYTKWSGRKPPKNYHLTYSASEKTPDSEVKQHAKNQNVAVVFGVKRGHPLPEKFEGIKVIDGDKSDARFLDPSNVIVGLRAKGRLIRNPGKFVRQVDIT